MDRVLKVSFILACTLLLCAACSTTRRATNFNGLSTPGGKPIAHLNTSNLALHLLVTRPLLGDATLEGTVDDFTKAAKQENAGKIQIVQSSVFSWWFIFSALLIRADAREQQCCRRRVAVSIEIAKFS